MLSFTACPDISGKSRTAGKTFIQTLFFFLLAIQICFAQWVQLGLSGYELRDIAARDSNIFAVLNYLGPYHGEVYRSTDNGVNWTMIVDSNAVDIEISPTGKVFLIKGDPWSLFWGDSLYSSLDNGETWTHINIEEQLLDSMLCVPRRITVSPEGIVYCCVHYPGCIGGHLDAIAQSNDDGLTWSIPCVGVMGGKIFDFRYPSIVTLGESFNCSTTYWSAIYISSNYGNSWTYLGYPPTTGVLSLFSNGNIIVGGEGLLDISTNNCSTWTQIATLNVKCGQSFSIGSSEGMLIGTDAYGILIYSDEGDSLGLWNEGLDYSWNVLSLSSDNNGYVYLAQGGNIMFGSGGVWRRPLSEIIPVELTSFTATLLGNEVILNWSTATETNNSGFSIERKSANSDYSEIGFVPGFGTTTEPKSYSYTDSKVSAGKYKYRLKQIDFDGNFEYSQEVEVEVAAPFTFSLEQNYPNPFNPSTVISYQLPVSSDVTLKVYDILSNEITTLVNENKPAGKFEVEFNPVSGNRYPASGIYFYQLKTGNYIDTKKMILIK